MELKFKAVRHKSMNPYLSKMVAGVFVLGILALANWVDDYLLLINYCIYALVAVLIFVGIYFIYFKLVGSEQQNLSFVSIEDEYFVFNKNKYH